VNIRPGVLKLLSTLSAVYEIVVFTASQKAYANVILDHIDREHKYIHHRLYREHCYPYSNNIYLKDLRILGRDLKNVVVVDNSPYAFAMQLDNGYPIQPFYDRRDDTELEQLTAYLLEIKNAGDVRLELRDKFRLREMIDTDIGKYIKFYQPCNSDISASASDRSSEPSQTPRDESPPVSEKVNIELQKYQLELDNIYGKKHA
jgi:Dullard-like phosphatase family protein